MAKYAVWPDGDYCEVKEVESMSWKSDDYRTMEFADDEAVEAYLLEKHMSGSFK